MYYEDFPVGFQFETATRQLSLADMVGFAQLWDPQPFHVDEVAAQASPFGGIIASGFQTLIVAFRLTIDTGFLRHAQWGHPGWTLCAGWHRCGRAIA
jgi:acyl dehydratase